MAEPRLGPTPALTTERLDLEPLTVAHAEEMVGVLADPALYAVTGGEPPSLHQLRERYRRQSAGASPDGTETWHNWVLRLRATDEAVGYVQATVTDDGVDPAAAVGDGIAGPSSTSAASVTGRRVAELAWVVAAAYQGQGYAAEAAAAVRDAMAAAGAVEIFACIAPGHAPSESVARRIGFSPTHDMVDGETRWVAARDSR